MALKVIKFQEVDPLQRAKHYRVELTDWPAGDSGGGSTFDPTDILARLDDAEESIGTLTQALGAAEDKIEALEAILLNVPSDTLLGRHAATDGPAQPVLPGPGLEIVGNYLILSATVIDSFTLECVTAPDVTSHEVTCVFEDGHYNLKVDQAVSGTGAVTGLDFVASDSTNHVMDLVLEAAFYQIRVNQTPGGAGSMATLAIRCTTDSVVKVLSVVLVDGLFYTWKLT